MGNQAQINKTAALITGVLIAIIISAYFLIIPKSESLTSISEQELMIDQDLLGCINSNGTQRESCFSNLALTRKNITYCYQDIGGEFNPCVDNLINLAIKNNDLSICHNDSFCIFRLANITKNQDVCNQLNSQEVIDDCKKQIQ